MQVRERTPSRRFPALLMPALVILSLSQPAFPQAGTDGTTSGRSVAPFSTPDKQGIWHDPSPTKVIASPTAFVQKKGTLDFNFSTFILGLFPPGVLNFASVTYGVTGNFDIKASMYVPVYYAGFGIYPKFSMQLGKYVRVGYVLDLAVVIPYNVVSEYDYIGCTVEDTGDADANVCRPWIIFGGTPLLVTIGNEDYHGNFSISTLGYRGLDYSCMISLGDHDECDWRLHNVVIVMASAAVSARVHKRLKITSELLYLYNYDFNVSDGSVPGGHSISPMVGFKILGKKFYGSINLLMIIVHGGGSWGPYLPYVYPFFTFGFIYS